MPVCAARALAGGFAGDMPPDVAAPVIPEKLTGLIGRG